MNNMAESTSSDEKSFLDPYGAPPVLELLWLERRQLRVTCINVT